jgi:endonuclease/exonuclease/phosphatase (EEP) superfamily protein YafD
VIPLAWLCGHRILALACVAVLLLHVAALSAQRFGPAAGAAAGAGRPLRIVSFNVLFSSTAYAQLIKFVQRVSPDVVCLHETTPDWQEHLAPLTARYAFSLFTGNGQRTGFACLSRIVPLRVVPPVTDGSAAPWMQLELASGGTAFTLVSAHMSLPIEAAGSAARNRQIAELARELQKVAQPVVVIGDFNVSPYSPYNADFVTTSRLRDCSRGHAPTWPTSFAPLWIQIDRCFVSEGVGVVRYQVGPELGSDHYPLIIDVRIPAGDTRVAGRQSNFGMELPVNSTASRSGLPGL